MNSNSLGKLALVTALFVLMAGVAMWRTASSGGAEAGLEPLFAELDDRLEEAAAVTVWSGEHKIEMAAVDGGWVLPEQHGYPVDFQRVLDNVRAFTEIEVLERKTSSAARHGALSLVEPVEGDATLADTASRIQVRDGSGGVLADLLVGQAAQGRSGALYVRKSGDDQCWLVEADFDLTGDRSRWIESEILRLEGEHTQLVTLVHPDGETLLVSKETPEEYNFTVHDVPEGRELQFESIGGNIGRAFNFLSLQDFRPASELDFEGGAGSMALVQGFDGVTITIRSVDEQGEPATEGGEGETTTWIHLSAVSEPTVGEDGSEVQPSAAARERANEINRRHADWAYSIASYTADNLKKRMDGLLKELEEPEVGPPLGPSAPTGAPAPTGLEAPIDPEGLIDLEGLIDPDAPAGASSPTGPAAATGAEEPVEDGGR